MSPPKIYAPNVHLFAYQLRKESNPQKDNLKELFEKGENILKQFGINQTIDIQDKPGYRVEIYAQQTEDAASIFFEKWSDSPITGIAYPVRIHDTFALALNVRRPEKNEQGIKTSDVDIDFFKRLHPSDCWMPSQVNASLGQTLLLTLWYTPEKTWQFWNSREDKKKLKSLADGCLRAFIPDKLDTPPFDRSGQLFGSPIFEYGINDELENYCHVLVWIFLTPEADTKLQEEYPNLVDIFCYRAKVIQAYKLSRSVYKVLSHNSEEVKAEIAIVESLPDNKTLDSSNLEELKKALKRIPRLNFSYVELIRDLNNYRLPLKINLQNYEREIKLLQKKYPQEDLSFLEIFADEKAHIFEEQIQADLDYFANGSDLLEKALNAIRGRVEIEQAERDRNLQTTIAVVGVGIGVAGVVSSSYTLAVDKPWAPPSFQHPLPLHPFFSAVIISCLCGGILGGLAWAIARKVLKSSPAQTRLTDSQNPPVNHILREAEEVRCLRQASLTNPPEQQ
ncbi:MAG: hypothetical protein EAZ98_17095 [Oscillatoriales cyanobacterium]|uniref:Uncharacterized protein n=1 Tax=Microcoleus anatoxicus PTRS2 TaxID=2705321 RepID=A0ABU8YK89_9CYAN|nr:MAG: hypothetical protein EA000_18915 [Oscillatoriales cyanobacterium]TAD95016.1 MAG: hypothetical protein EAZ98_17095 [Oscillatoriales cyanobacterium]